MSGVHAGGGPEAFSRLVLGHGQQLGAALIKGGVSPDRRDAVVAALEAEMHVPLVEPPMPIQDAIDFAEFLVHTTAGFSRFSLTNDVYAWPVRLVNFDRANA